MMSSYDNSGCIYAFSYLSNEIILCYTLFWHLPNCVYVL